MKKLRTLALVALCVVLAAWGLCGCGSGDKEQPNTLKDGKTLADVMAAVNQKFADTYGADISAIPMAMEVTEQELNEMVGLSSEDYEEFVGAFAMSMTNSDRFLAIKAKEGRADAVKAALETYKTNLENQFEFYNVMGSYDRAKAGEVYQKGDYVFLIVVGTMPEDPDAAVDFTPDVEMTKQVIDEMFY